MQKDTLIKKLKIEIRQCLLLEEIEKKNWIENIEKFPAVALEQIYSLVHEKNELMEQYFRAAQQNDPDQFFLRELKLKIKKLKKNTLVIAEQEQTPNVDELLKNGLANL